MASERIRRRIDSLLDQAEEAIEREDWAVVAARARAVLRLDSSNTDAKAYLDASGQPEESSEDSPAVATVVPPPSEPTSFANGRYEVKRFLGEGGKKKVYLAHDTQLDRDVAFALIKTQGLDESARVRVTREAQAMGRLGSHPYIVTVYDIGEEDGQLYLVLPLLTGGDVEGVIEKSEEHKMSIEQVIKIGIETCLGLEFSHSKGIIHRDLKPGNVWLAEDGRAMIGDFGLAVAVDRSRLTQAGMMVGTVNYMPPEQAMGGEVNPMSDLYSLGAMLYEMVCGRPPFVGDESVAIIGQHLNTPPVAPSWHRPDCPPGLEALILRLLEKDPQKRPTSAGEVKEMLQSINPTEKATAPRLDLEGSPHYDSPFYRSTFIGREQELRQLKAAFDAATSGRGGLLMVVGETGIGKSMLCEQLTTYVSIRGGTTLIGHCYEDGSLSLPYLAFVEAIRGYVLTRDLPELRSEMGTAAGEVARIVSEVAERLQILPSSAGEPEQQRWRLMEGVSQFLRNAASLQPAMILLEDLHWADKGTLDLLVHLARRISDARILVVGTYRDTDVDRGHPLGSALADLRRVANFSRVSLHGLSRDEVARMYEAISGHASPLRRTELVHQQTEGNPLFVQEVIRYFMEEQGSSGTVDDITSQSQTLPIPDGIREVVGKRVSRLSESANRILEIASVLGQDFRLDVLQGIAGATTEVIEDALKEAAQHSIVAQRSEDSQVGFSFTHVFYRQTLYEEIFPSRRLRLHQQVARALESIYRSRLEDHAGELADHFSKSTDEHDLVKARDYSELAASRAERVFALGDAGRYFEQALKVQDVLDPEDGRKKLDLLLKAGRNFVRDRQQSRVLEFYARDALTLSESLNDSQSAAQACRLAMEAFQRRGGRGMTLMPEWTFWVDAYSRHVGNRTSDQIRLGIEKSEFNHINGFEAEARLEREAALKLARRVCDPEELAYATAFSIFYTQAPGFERVRLELATEAEKWSTEGVSPRTLGLLYGYIGQAFSDWGQSEKAGTTWDLLHELPTQVPDYHVILLDLFHSSIRVAISGRLEEALQLGSQLLAAGEEFNAAAGGLRMSALCTFRARIHLGLAGEALRSLDLLARLAGSDQDSVVEQPLRALALAHLGRSDQAGELVEGIIRDRSISSDEDGKVATTDLMALLEAACLTDNAHLALALARRLQGLSDVIKVHGSIQTSVARLLGDAAWLNKRFHEAKNLYAHALSVAQQAAFRPEAALCRLSLAQILNESFPEDHPSATEHLDFAISEFRDMKMQPALERALRHRQILKA